MSSGSLGQRVAALITSQLESGRVKVESISSELCMSRYTLHKRLKVENQTFAGLLQEVRRKLALTYIQDRDRPLVEVAEMLGFSELSAFSRAFKRWMGQSPAAFRSARLPLPGLVKSF
ncbi:helix-turn-helix transcriptional regulator [Marinobacter changyiensis]|uniref:helix-turn-helix transcriptional regulator n=1 Tax=Marinobacter changyiensis TaxID=2604091 RepID=UPI0012658211|nr:helix-turn-helix transcriptional regulator [Marinobacter changyiensis]